MARLNPHFYGTAAMIINYKKYIFLLIGLISCQLSALRIHQKSPLPNVSFEYQRHNSLTKSINAHYYASKNRREFVAKIVYGRIHNKPHCYIRDYFSDSIYPHSYALKQELHQRALEDMRCMGCETIIVTAPSGDTFHLDNGGQSYLPFNEKHGQFEPYNFFQYTFKKPVVRDPKKDLYSERAQFMNYNY